jgi:hypothetical protein
MAWLAALALAYLIAQPPASLPVVLALGRALINLLAVGLMLAISGGIGTLIVPDLPPLGRLEMAILRALIGVGAFSLSVLALGAAGAFPSAGLGWAIMIALAAGLMRPLRRWLGDLIGGLRQVFAAPVDRVTGWLRGSLGVLLAMALIYALAPVTAWDALSYHLAGPQVYLSHGRIIAYPQNFFMSYPQIIEMAYLWLLIVAAPPAAGVLHLAFGLLLMGLVLGLAHRLGLINTGWWALAILLTGLTFWMELHWAYSDMPMAAYGFAILLTLHAHLPLVRGRTDAAQRRQGGVESVAGGSQHLLWAGVLVGLVMGIKYTAVGLALAAALITAIISWRGGIRLTLRNLTILTLSAVGVFTPWLIKNTLLDGNPVAPFGWGTLKFDALYRELFFKAGTGMPLPDLLIMPVQASVFGQQGMDPYDATVGPLLIGLLPLAWLAWRRGGDERRLVGHLLTLAVVPFALWVYGAANSWAYIMPRYLTMITAAVALAGALGLRALDQMEGAKVFAWAARGLIGLVLISTLARALVMFVADQPAAPVLGLESEDSYLLDKLGTHYAAMQAINKLPDTARVLTLFEPRSFYCDRRCLPDLIAGEWWRIRQDGLTSDQIVERWRDQGITHVLIWQSALDFMLHDHKFPILTQADGAALEDLRRTHLELVEDIVGSYRLYRLK